MALDQLLISIRNATWLTIKRVSVHLRKSSSIHVSPLPIPGQQCVVTVLVVCLLRCSNRLISHHWRGNTEHSKLKLVQWFDGFYQHSILIKYTATDNDKLQLWPAGINNDDTRTPSMMKQWLIESLTKRRWLNDGGLMMEQWLIESNKDDSTTLDWVCLHITYYTTWQQQNHQNNGGSLLIRSHLSAATAHPHKFSPIEFNDQWC